MKDDNPFRIRVEQPTATLCVVSVRGKDVAAFCGDWARAEALDFAEKVELEGYAAVNRERRIRGVPPVSQPHIHQGYSRFY